MGPQNKSGKKGVSGREIVQALREDLDEIIDELANCNRPVETRRTLHDPYLTLMKGGYELTGAKIRWVPPSEDPSSEEMGESVRNLRDQITPDNISQRATKDDILAFRDAIVDFLYKLEQTSSLDYAFKEEDIKQKHGRWVQSIGLRDDVDPDDLENDDGREIFAGPRARIELEQKPREARHVSNYDVPLFLGTGVRKGKDATLPKETLYRHVAVLGVTGYGKSTLLTNVQKQIIESGEGLCFIDPKGDDSERLVEILPEDRRDDLIWIEPGNTSGKISGFNFINVGLSPDHPQIETAVSALVSDLKKMLGAGKYWGPRMDRIASNLIRAMNVYNRKNPDKPDLNLADLYYVLQDPRSRHEFSVLVQAEGIDFIEDYTEKIAEMDDDKLEPILGRMQPWIESPAARRMICFRNSEVNIPQAVNDGKIIVVRMGGQPKDLKRMLGMAVVRRIWATIRARAELAEHERSPFYLFVDEAHNIALADETFPTMLAESRSYRLSINLSTQYLSQLPENVIRAVRVNCDTLMSFNAGSQEEAAKIAPQLDLKPQALLNEARFHIWMRMTDPESGELTDPFKVYIHPPFPPCRTNDEAQEIIKTSLDKYGREKMTPEERKQGLQFYQGAGQLETGVGSEILRAEMDSEMPPEVVESIKMKAIKSRRKQIHGGQEMVEDEEISEKDSSELDSTDQNILQSIFAARIKAGRKPGEPVEVERVLTEIENRIGDIGYGSDIANAVEALAQFIELTTFDGEESLRLTPDGRAEIFENTGESVTGGLYSHRRVLRETFELFTRLGYHTSLPTQAGEEMPDGLAETPFNPADIDTRGKSVDEIQELLDNRVAKLEEQFPHVAALSNGESLRIEAETNTQFKPAQMLTNLRKSINDGKKTAFVTKDAYFEEGSRVPDDVEDTTAWWCRYIERNLYDRKYDSENGEKITKYGDENVILARKRTDEGLVLYNSKDDYEVEIEGDMYKALRPDPDGQGRTTWREAEDGRVLAEDADNGVFAEFDSQEHAAEGDPTAVPAYYYYDRSDEEYVVKQGGEELTYNSRDELGEEWQTFKGPFLPDVEFDREPTEDDFIIIVIPNAENPHHDQPLLYEHGETTPLYDALGMDLPDHAYITEASRQELQNLEDEKRQEPVESESSEDEQETEADERASDETDTSSKKSDSEDNSESGASTTVTNDETTVFDEVDLERKEDNSAGGETKKGEDNVEYLFPAVKSVDDLPHACPQCQTGELQTKSGQPYVGPAPTIENFPAIASALSEEVTLELGEVPYISEPLQTTLAICRNCSLACPIYLPRQEKEISKQVDEVDPPTVSQDEGAESTSEDGEKTFTDEIFDV